MQNQIDNQIEASVKMREAFNEWIYKACVLKAGARDPHDIFPYVDLTDAKLSFLDGMSYEEYSKYINL